MRKTEPTPLDEQSLFKACPECKTILFINDLVANAWVCTKPSCGHHFVITAQERLRVITEPGSFEEWDAELSSRDPLGFPGFAEKLVEVTTKTGMHSAAVTGVAMIGGFRVGIGITDYHFMAGAMNSVVGEKFARAIEGAIAQRLPFILISGSGAGAMMHEGLISLMQMPRITAALARHKRAGLMSVCLLTDATYGGVIASWASLAHITLAEPKARIGFVGGRVSGLKVFEGAPHKFRTAEYQLEHGAIDQIVPRTELKGALLAILASTAEFTGAAGERLLSIAEEVRASLPREEDDFLHDQSGTRRLHVTDAADNLRLARHVNRPHTLDFIKGIFDSFFELKGDKSLKDDGAIVGGVASLGGVRVVVIGHEKNRDMKERTLRNYGMAGPAGYRKAARLMRLAELLRCPLLCFIDTPGADITVESENYGISYALAQCQEILLNLETPVVSTIIGEGGSGGAIALGVADKVLILQHAIYSVIAPEKCASIVWKDESRVAEAAAALKITALDTVRLGVTDCLVPEPAEGAHMDRDAAVQILKAHLAETLAELAQVEDTQILVTGRYERFRAINSFLG
ncbi:MAG TPA: acetyl-CoA carboxylase carboxyltransferase subunit alpha/beta [Verrucomicrobiae bacterium]|nr:acetyl-CoA carboxylase carboxyltransferase subunit alpha/beta [Verrucomicrobiae bacterium]